MSRERTGPKPPNPWMNPKPEAVEEYKRLLAEENGRAAIAADTTLSFEERMARLHPDLCVPTPDEFAAFMAAKDRMESYLVDAARVWYAARHQRMPYQATVTAITADDGEDPHGVVEVEFYDEEWRERAQEEGPDTHWIPARDLLPELGRRAALLDALAAPGA